MELPDLNSISRYPQPVNIHRVRKHESGFSKDQKFNFFQISVSPKSPELHNFMKNDRSESLSPSDNHLTENTRISGRGNDGLYGLITTRSYFLCPASNEITFLRGTRLPIIDYKSICIFGPYLSQTSRSCTKDKIDACSPRLPSKNIVI